MVIENYEKKKIINNQSFISIKIYFKKKSSLLSLFITNKTIKGSYNYIIN